MKCINCEAEIESDDNFCWKCGHWTAKGYTFLHDKCNIETITNGDVLKQSDRFNTIISLLMVGFLTFGCFFLIRGYDLFRPIAFLKKQILTYTYGYNTTLIDTNKKYNRINVSNYDDSINYIKKSFQEQEYMCYKNVDLSMIEYHLSEDYSIPSVLFCDLSLEEATKIETIIKKMYTLFPNLNKTALTNISISNASKSSEYIAKFQPIFQFVNVNEDINKYNKVNRTQILLNSYYFLNDKIISRPIEEIVGKDWYVEDATFESTIAHEFGHYISFTILLKSQGLSNIVFENIDNEKQIKEIIEIVNSGDFSNQLVNEALNNYNEKYNTNIDINTFALSISNYAAYKDKNNNLVYDETIAEAVHDYYLHENNMKQSSAEIINVIKKRMN